MIVPTGDADIGHFARNESMLSKMGIINFMSDYKTILNCQDKLSFYNEATKKGLVHLFPETSANWEDIEFPILCKPKRGSGSRGIELWHNESQVKDFSLIENLHYSSDYIYQEYLPGTEYTIDVFCDLDGNVLSVIPRERLQTKAGISSKGRIVRNKEIEKACSQLCKSFKVKGPVCIQMKEDISGHPIFVEMNPRFGGGTYFTTLAGVNFMKLMIDIVEKNEIKVSEPDEITVLRYYNEIVV